MALTYDPPSPAITQAFYSENPIYEGETVWLRVKAVNVPVVRTQVAAITGQAISGILQAIPPQAPNSSGGSVGNITITSVQATVLGQTHTLTYNDDTEYYEVSVTPTVSSSAQPGGYYSTTVTVTNSLGATVTADSASFKALRLVVREAVAPVLTLVSPPQGIITTGAPTIKLLATDEGSGINRDAVTMTVDGQSVTPVVVTNPAGGCAIRYNAALSDGAHQIIVTVQDYDLNSATLTLSYTVDTAPPVLTLYTDGLRRVVDDESLLVSGRVKDATTGVSSLVISGGSETVNAAVSASGSFAETVPLAVGVNDITITATDAAGLASTESFRAVRLITDRTRADVDAAAELVKRALTQGWDSLSEAEQALYYDGLRGTYSFVDTNRVNEAEAVLKPLMAALGYNVQGTYRTDRTDADDFPLSERTEYLNNARELRDIVSVTLPLPADMENFTETEANEIEAALVMVDAVYPNIEKSFVYCGRAICGMH